MLTLFVSLEDIAHFAWDLSLGQIRTSSQKKKKWGGIRHFKSQAENYKSVCLSGFVYVSVCVFGFFFYIDEVVNEF